MFYTGIIMSQKWNMNHVLQRCDGYMANSDGSGDRGKGDSAHTSTVQRSVIQDLLWQESELVEIDDALKVTVAVRAWDVPWALTG